MLSLLTNKAGDPFSWCNLTLPNITNVDICELFFSRRLKMNVLISYVVRKLFNNETRPPKLTMETVAETCIVAHTKTNEWMGIYTALKNRRKPFCVHDDSARFWSIHHSFSRVVDVVVVVVVYGAWETHIEERGQQHKRVGTTRKPKRNT